MTPEPASKSAMTLRIVRRLLPGLGTTYGPAGDSRCPAVLLLHGSEGGLSGWSHRNAVMLAAHGFLAFPFPYSVGGNPWNAGSIENVELMNTVLALRGLRRFEACNGRVALFGVSRGAEHALLVAALMSRGKLEGEPDAVAVHAAPDVVCAAFDSRTRRDTGDDGWAAWDPAKRAWLWNGSSEGLLPTAPIPIETYSGPLLLTHGERDSVWSVETTRRLAKRLLAAGLKPEVRYFKDEDHSLRSDAENVFNETLLNFLWRSLRTEMSQP
jgi:pimeloyl-ACP methyl ester carboxylesterase